MRPASLGKACIKVASVIVSPIYFIARALKYLLLPFVWLITIAVVLLAVLVFAVPTTPRDVAYRNIDPDSDVCGFSYGKAAEAVGDAPIATKGWEVLADAAINNDEEKAIAKFPNGGWERKFGCSLQRHTVPAAVGGQPLSYNLAFIEFREEGAPYEFIKDAGTPYSPEELSSRVRYVDENQRKPITQLRAVTKLLRQNAGRNYVIVFIHGWRHDARIGDENVGDLRLYAAHAARFLQERCRAGEREQCDRVVTAVYIGWRGARIDEDRIRRLFVVVGNWLDGGIGHCRGVEGDKAAKSVDGKTVECWRKILGGWGNGAASLAAALTLFDRKPVSEAIAPHVFTALRSIESTFEFEDKGTTIPFYDRLHNPNRLLVIGHSLGGNLLATALQHDVAKRVDWQAQRNNEALAESRKLSGDAQQTYFDPPLGNLVVLINPASEARKWTTIQRAVWNKIIFRSGEGKSDEEYEQGHRFFPSYQRPVLIAVTSAFAWPPGGIRAEDCAIAFNFDKPFMDNPPVTAGADHRRRVEKLLHGAISDVDDKSRKGGVVYDSATHDLFPFFKFDFRPMADRLDRYGRFLADQKVPKLSCDKEAEVTSWWPKLLIKMAALLRDAPFQESDMEETRTIGNLDVPRHAAGSLIDNLLTARPFGTTHEIRGGTNPAVSMSYSDLAKSSLVQCPISDFWLSRARRDKPKYGTGWSSDELSAPAADENPSAGSISARISHGFELAGMQPITRANDPFWNMRAYDDVIAAHSGYKLSSFICAINQLVMDEPTKIPSPPKATAPIAAAKGPAENLTDAAPPGVTNKK
jgi:hypothetical protein